MVVGNGLIAKSMSSFINEDDILIFASGVSNSKEKDTSKYEREINILKTYYNTNKKFIYFSTCSVLYDCIENTEYIEHKKKIEHIILNNFKNYLIFRLPNIVGVTNNPNTSFNFFKNNLKHGININVEKFTTRYFIDIVDVVDTLTPIILDNKNNKKTFNVCFNSKINIFDFIMMMSKHMNVDPKIILEENGCSLDVNNNEFINLLDKKYKLIDGDYNIKLIKKYC